jgi:hypothetical protein
MIVDIRWTGNIVLNTINKHIGKANFHQYIGNLPADLEHITETAQSSTNKRLRIRQ